MHWLDKNYLEINGISFYVDGIFKKLPDKYKHNEFFSIAKGTEDFTLYYDEIKDLKLEKVIEIGIYEGGSVAFMNAAFKPKKLLAIEFSEKRVKNLDKYIEAHTEAGSVLCEYGLDQSDKQRLPALLEKHFPNRDVDIVVDDASHLYEESKASFNMIFPYLRTGAVYIIEDWSWAHSGMALFEAADGLWHDKLSLSNLLFEVMLAYASCPGLISGVKVNKNMIFVTKGDRHIEPGEFDVSAAYFTRGRVFEPTL
jgi:predicted O-methyltransferase YrrM